MPRPLSMKFSTSDQEEGWYASDSFESMVPAHDVVSSACRPRSKNHSRLEFAGWKGGLPPLQIPALNSELLFQGECLLILSGGTPPFPTCEFPYLTSILTELRRNHENGFIHAT